MVEPTIETEVVALSIDERAEFKNLEGIIREGLAHYEKAKAGVVLAMYEIWSRRLWQAEHPSLEDWRESQLASSKNHLAIRQTFYDHMESMAKAISSGLEKERAALLIAKSSGAPEQLKVLGVEFKKSDRGRDAEYEVIVPDDFEEKTGKESVSDYLDDMAGMSRSEMQKAVRHDSGKTIVSFSGLLKINEFPTQMVGRWMFDAWTNGPDEWTSRQVFIGIQKGTPKEVIAAILKRLNKDFEA